MKRSAIFFFLCLLMLLAALVAALFERGILAAALVVAAAFFLVLLWRATAKPVSAISAGMDLLRSQDFASRLRPVGQKDADEVVETFNALMATMKAERLRTEEQQAFLAKLVEASPMGVAVCNLEGAIISENPSFTALTADISRGELFSLADGEQRVLRPGAGQVLRVTRMHFMDRGFRRTFFLAERLTDEILRAETEVFNKIVRTMGHEVNNTLGGVVSVMETLHSLHEGEAIVTQAIDSCMDSCRALGAFVKSYADIVKLPQAELSALDPAAFVTGLSAFLGGMCPPGVSLEVDCAEAEPVAGDAMLLERVLVNAVKNAVESIGDRQDGRIILRAHGRTIEVVDNGAGISPEAASRIFTPFFSTKNADRGLGLMLISDILRKHKATFTLATGADGLTRLTITFPRRG